MKSASLDKSTSAVFHYLCWMGSDNPNKLHCPAATPSSDATGNRNESEKGEGKMPAMKDMQCDEE